MSESIALVLPLGYRAGDDVIDPDDPPGEWDWLVAKLVGPVRDQIWGSLVAFVQHELDILIAPLREIRDRLYWLLAAMQAAPSIINNAVNSLRDHVVGQIAYWLAAIRAGADAIRDRIGAELAAARVAVQATLAGWLGAIRAALDGLRERIASELTSARVLLATTLAGWLNNLRAGVEALRERIASEMAAARALISGTLAAWLGQAVAILNSIPERLAAAWRGLLLMAIEWLQARFADWTRASQNALFGLLNIGSQVVLGMGEQLAKGPPPQLNAILGRMTASLEAGLAGIQGIVLGQGQITPELAPAVAVRAFGAASGLGFSAHLLSTAIELVHPLRYVGLHFLSGFLADMGSFSSVSNAIMGVMCREAIGYPMAYNIRARTRPTIPTTGDLQAMRRKHNLWASEFAQGMAYQGYSDFWIQRFEEYLPADPRLLELARIFESSAPSGAPGADAIAYLERLGITTRAIPDWWIEMKLALAGYNWIDIPQLKGALMHKVSNSSRLRLDAAASVLFRNGYMEEATFRATIARSEATPDALEMKVRAEKLAALGDDIQDLVALYTDQFLKDVLTEAELLLALVNCGVTRHKAEILTARAAIRKMPKPAAPSRAAEEAELKKLQTSYSELYRRQYAADLITADAYYNDLVAVGIAPRLAAVAVEIELTKRVASERTVALRDQAKAAAQTRAVYEKLYQAQYRAGALDADAYADRLLALGLPEDQARGQVALEEVRAYALVQRAEATEAEKEAAAEQKAAAELVVRRYRDGTVDAAGLLDRLVALGIPQVLAATTVSLERQKRGEDAARVLGQVIIPALKVPFELAVERLEAQLAAGEIDGAGFLAGLAATGLAEDTAALILEVLRPA